MSRYCRCLLAAALFFAICFAFDCAMFTPTDASDMRNAAYDAACYAVRAAAMPCARDTLRAMREAAELCVSPAREGCVS